MVTPGRYIALFLGAEVVLEMYVSDIAGIVIAGKCADLRAPDVVKVSLDRGVLLEEPVVGQVPRDHHCVRLKLVYLDYNALDKVRHEVVRTNVDIGDMGNNDVFVRAP